MVTIITHASQTGGISSVELFRIAANNAAYAMALYRGLKADAVKQREAGDHTTAFWSRTAAVKEQFRAYAIMGPFRSAIGNRTQRELEQALFDHLTLHARFDDSVGPQGHCDHCGHDFRWHIALGISAWQCVGGRDYWQLARAILEYDGPIREGDDPFGLRILARRK